MDSQTQLAEYNDGVSTPVEENIAEAEINTELASNAATSTDQSVADSIQASLQDESSIQPAMATQTSWQNEPSTEPTIVAQLSAFSAYLGGFWREFSQSSRPFLVRLAWVLVALIALKIVAAIVNAVNSIPLLAPLFQLIGAGYALWFINRYLLRRSTRQELSQKVKNFTEQAFGQPSDSNLAASVPNSALAVNNRAASDPTMLEE